MDNDRRDSLVAAERRLQAAQLASDVPALADLLDEHVLFTGPDGNLYTRDDDLRVHRTGHQKMTRVDEEDLTVRTFGDDVGVTYFLGTVEATIDGVDVAERMRYTRTWRYHDGRWRIISAHASFV